MIGFVGLAHLGIVSSIAAAAKGHSVVGYDPNADLVLNLQKGALPVLEPGLDDCLTTSRQNIAFISNPDGLHDCDLVIFSLDVPTDKDNCSDLSQLKALMGDIMPRVKSSATFVVLSQVPPGFTRGLAESRIFCQVETLVFGAALERALKPERFMVGCADPSGPLPAPFADYLGSFGCPVLQMRYESAELAKIAINMFLIASVSMTNTLAELCEGIGAEWSEIAPALRLDRRIGPHAYLSPGLGISGGNLERDLATVRNLAMEFGTESAVADACLASSTYRKSWVLRRLGVALQSKSDPVVAVLGLTYKAHTASIKNSPAVELINSLSGIAVRAYDPEAPAIPFASDRVTRVAAAESAYEGADALVIATAWPEFSRLDPAKIKRAMAADVVIDPYGVLVGDCKTIGLQYFKLGARP